MPKEFLKKIRKNMEPKIDFYLIDSADIINFEPIFRHLKNAVFIADPTIDWFDYRRAVLYLQEHRLPFKRSPRLGVDCVITTQIHKVVELPEYKHAITMRLMYGLGEKNQNHQPEFNRGFDVILVPGEYSKRLLSQYNFAIIVGFPKYDSYFSGEIKKKELSQQFNINPSKKTVLYLPTWGIYSSIDKYYKAIKQIVNLGNYNFIFKPHAVTIRKERYRIDYFISEIKEGKMILVEKLMGLDKLFTIADLIIADGMSGAFWEAIFITDLPTLAIHTELNFQKNNLEKEIHKFAPVNNEPALLLEDLKKVEENLSEFISIRRRERENMIAFRDGTAGKEAAQKILDYIKSKKLLEVRHLMVSEYLFLYIIKIFRLLFPFGRWFKNLVRNKFPTFFCILEKCYRFVKNIKNF